LRRKRYNYVTNSGNKFASILTIEKKRLKKPSKPDGQAKGKDSPFLKFTLNGYLSPM